MRLERAGRNFADAVQLTGKPRGSRAYLTASSWLLAMCVFVSTWGCVPTTSAPPAPPPMAQGTVSVPRFALMSDSSAVQKKGGITISLAPSSYGSAQKVRVTEEDKRRPILFLEPTPGRTTVRWFDKIETPYWVVDPPHLKFSVKITNNLDSTLRMAGSIVTYAINGRALNVPQEKIATFANTIVPRRQTMDTSVEGPSISELDSSGGTVFVSVDDVVTEVDAAGNPTRRSNFEWFYSYSFTTETKSGEIKRTGYTSSVPGTR